VVWLMTLSGMLLAAAYLAKVRVYEVRRGSMNEPVVDDQRPSTLIETMLLHKRRVLEVLVDFSLIASAYVAAYLLRFDGVLSGDVQRLIVQSLPVNQENSWSDRVSTDVFAG